MARYIQVIAAFVFQQLSQWINAWTKFWFAPQDPIALCFMRCLVGGMVFYTHWVWGLRFEEFFADETSWQTRELISAIQADQYVFTFWDFVPGPWKWEIHLACLAILFFFWFGIATRLTSWLAFIITISYAQRVPLATFGLDQINGLSCLYLAMSPCGVRLSIDSWLLNSLQTSRRFNGPRISKFLAWWVNPRATSSTRLATRLLQVHLCVIYLWAGLGKLKGETWWSGEALWLAASNFEYQSNNLTWLIHIPWFYQLVTVITWAWEISFPMLVWHNTLRWPMLAVGLMMHFGIGMFMGMWTFALAMVFVYTAFLDPQFVHNIANLAFPRLVQPRSSLNIHAHS